MMLVIALLIIALISSFMVCMYAAMIMSEELHNCNEWDAEEDEEGDRECTNQN